MRRLVADRPGTCRRRARRRRPRSSWSRRRRSATPIILKCCSDFGGPAAIAESKKFAGWYRQRARRRRRAVSSTPATVAEADPADGVHLDAANTRAIGDGLAPLVQQRARAMTDVSPYARPQVRCRRDRAAGQHRAPWRHRAGLGATDAAEGTYDPIEVGRLQMMKRRHRIRLAQRRRWPRSRARSSA